MQNNVLDYLNETVIRKPDKVAFSNGTDSLTFSEVYNQSRAIGSWIHGQGIYKEPVVVFMDKHPRTVTAFLGVITGGCFYIPVDAEMPAMRIALILQNVNARAMICDCNTAKIAAGLEFSGKTILYDDIYKTEADGTALRKIHEEALDTDLTYVVFTSGSTGVPKGVTGCHRSTIDYVEQLSEILWFGEDTVFGNQAPLYFDACMKEIYPTLKFGATTYLIPKELFLFPIKLVEFLNQQRINTLCWVVSALTMISSFGTFESIVPEYLRTIAFVGEVFPIKQFKKWQKVLPEADYVNLYGPTEATGVCCYYRVDREFAEDEVLPIGRPFKNIEIILLNDSNEKVMDGEEGEICIRGTCLAHGYFHDLERTKEAFVQNPLNPAYPEIIYRTGDIGRLNENGELMFVSRKDFQIKHMGHRIELGEIEVYVNAVEGVDIAGCVYEKKKSRIVLFYVGEILEKDLAALIKKKIPRYMVPNRFCKIDEMPHTPNGKIDRKTLLDQCCNGL